MKKTLVVVSALVALAVAAPALPGDGLENTDRTQDRHLQTQSSLPDTLKRERNSPSEISTSSILNNGVSNSEVQNVHIDAGVSTPTGRSFTLKKPLIVKKKYGYQLYRDSEEEKAHADSNETCGRQVKVKLCNEDDKLRTSVTGSAHEGSDIHTTEDDVKHSIKMAKEAVENLQRDLKKMETKPDMKIANESQSDTELHEDIEVARQALKHIHENFGTLESMSLHATTTRNSEDIHDVHVTIAKTEEERMAQWKEALENIQKNFDIARNIEDSFKAASNQDSTLHLDQSEAAPTVADQKTEENIHSHAALSEVKNLRLAHDGALETHHQEKKSAEEMILNKDTTEHLHQHNVAMEQNTEDDMNTAPSEMIEIHLDKIKSQEPLRSENHKIHEHEKSAEANLEEHNVYTENKDLLNKKNIGDHHQEKSAEFNMDILTGQSEHNIVQPSMKAVEEVSETKFVHTENKDLLNKENFVNHHQEKSAELNMDLLTGQSEHNIMQIPSMKAVEEGTETKFVHTENKDLLNKKNIVDHHQEKSAELNMDMLTGQSEHNIMQVTPITTSTIIKPLTSEAFSEHQKSAEQIAIEDKIEHHFLQQKNADAHMIDFFAKSADHLDHDKTEKEDLHKEHLIELAKAAENSKPEQKEHLALESVEIKHLDSLPKSAEQLEHTHFHNLGKHNENVMLAKSVDHTSILDHQKQQMMQHDVLSSMETVPEMKAAEEHLHHLQHMHNAHWAHENTHLDHLSSMKAAEKFDEFRMAHAQAHEHGIIPEHTMDHLRNSHLAEHQIPSKMGVSHDFEMASHIPAHPNHPARHHHNSLSHSQMHEMGMGMHSNFQPSMRDAMEGFGSDHMLRWEPAQESARVAYGSGLSSSAGSTGAVGVFPNANIGGCGIPLLLSCSPSVVSGSLAKAHSAGLSSYSSPSYRMEEDFGFHNKRDIKKTNDMRTTNVLRSPAIVKQKNSIAQENKM